MKQFNHEYISIVDNLRIMGDALVLLNPIKRIKSNLNHYQTTSAPTGSGLANYNQNDYQD